MWKVKWKEFGEEHEKVFDTEKEAVNFSIGVRMRNPTVLTKIEEVRG